MKIVSLVLCNCVLLTVSQVEGGEFAGIYVKEDSSRERVEFSVDGANRSRPGVAGVADWSSRKRQNQRHVRHVVRAAADHSRTVCRVAA